MKKISMIMFVMLISMAVLTGCAGEAENVDNNAVSEVVSESISETSEDISSEEAVDEVDYSAETVMALCDELSQKYQYDDPEYIKSLVIAANLDYITDEDLEIILSTYGYTMEDLAVVYEEGISSAVVAYRRTYTYMSGAVDVEFNDEVDYANRILFQEVMLNSNDKELAAQFDESAIVHDGEGVNDFIVEEPLTSCENLLSSVAYSFRRGVVDNVYKDYIQ